MLFLVRWFAKRSLRLLHALGSALGWAGYALSPSYRRRLVENASLAGLGAAERRAAVGDAGKLVMELPRLWLRPRDQPIADPVRWDGDALLAALLDRGKGLVLLTPHMGSFEVSAQAYAERFGARQPITVLYRPARQPWLRTLEETARARTALATAPADFSGVRLMMRALRRGETVGLAAAGRDCSDYRDRPGTIVCTSVMRQGMRAYAAREYTFGMGNRIVYVLTMYEMRRPKGMNELDDVEKENSKGITESNAIVESIAQR